MRILIFFLILFCNPSFAAPDVKTYIPEKAYKYVPVMKKELDAYFPTFPVHHYFGGLAEIESCIYLTHKRCWDPSSKLESPRELGIGIPQLTKAYNKDGSIRFDVLADLRRAHPVELKELNWQNIESRPDLQFRGMIFLTKGNWNRFSNIPNVFEQIKFTDAAYNGGAGGVNNERRACGLAKGCNPKVWTGNVERYCLKSKKPLYGNRSACDINRDHVRDVFIRMPKYESLFTKK